MKMITLLFVLLSTHALFASNQKTRYKAQQRVVAIGDFHGNFEVALKAMQAGKLIDKKGNWIGGKTTFVQVGDQLDRGNHERELMEYLEKLTVQAKKAGGRVIILNGNHETLNVQLIFNYVGTHAAPGEDPDKGFKDFDEFYIPKKHDLDYKLQAFLSDNNFERKTWGRVMAFRPGGVYAKKLAKQNTVVIVGDTLFVHGGILPEHVAPDAEGMSGVGRLAEINKKISDWMLGLIEEPKELTQANESPVWTRELSGVPVVDCARVDQTLKALKIKRIVVAHTIQKELNSVCNQKVWRIDTGLYSPGNNSTVIQALEITDKGKNVQVLDYYKPKP